MMATFHNTSTTLRPIPHTAYMDSFIKAYYLAEKDVNAWVTQNREMYTTKQLISVVTVGLFGQNKDCKTARKNLIKFLEESEKQRHQRY
jgi:hypothetical protein